MNHSEEDSPPQDVQSETSSAISSTWNTSQEMLLKGISERANCSRWLHTQCNLHFESLNFYFTIPNVIISTLNGSFTMALNSLFPEPGAQQSATTVIGLISILSAVLITMNQYVKSQQMMEAHRAAGLAYGKLHRLIQNELALRRDQRSNALEFLKLIRSEQDRLENTSPSVIPSIIKKFNIQFADAQIEKPEICGDLDPTEINEARRKKKEAEQRGSPIQAVGNRIRTLLSPAIRNIPSFSNSLEEESKETDRPDTPPVELLNVPSVGSPPLALSIPPVLKNRFTTPTHIITQK